jgi:hypothetical protein
MAQRQNPNITLDIIGKRFGSVVVISYSHTARRRSHWHCRCDCGALVIKGRDCLRNRNISGCEDCGRERNRIVGKLRGSDSPNFKHGHKLGYTCSRTYASWAMMLARCGNPNDNRYHRYGGRGITVYERWQRSFSYFLEDMGERPIGSTLDRIDNNGNYTPQNCRWATREEQANNKSNSCRITFEGRTQTVAQWARELGISHMTIRSRLKMGRPLEEVFSPSSLRWPDSNAQGGSHAIQKRVRYSL